MRRDSGFFTIDRNILSIADGLLRGFGWMEKNKIWNKRFETFRPVRSGCGVLLIGYFNVTFDNP
jgi:hypothetical protein